MLLGRIEVPALSIKHNKIINLQVPTYRRLLTHLATLVTRARKRTTLTNL